MGLVSVRDTSSGDGYRRGGERVLVVRGGGGEGIGGL